MGSIVCDPLGSALPPLGILHGLESVLPVSSLYRFSCTLTRRSLPELRWSCCE